MQRCADAYPHITASVDPRDLEARSKPGMSALREHAVVLGRQVVTEEVLSLQHSAVEPSSPEYCQSKTHILSRLKRLLPGTVPAVTAVRTTDGQVTTDPSIIAHALKEHWGRVFTAAPIDHNLLQTWLDSLPHLRAVSSPVPSLVTGTAEAPILNADPLGRPHSRRQPLSSNGQDWKIRRKDISRSIKMSGNSAPGPDGIPFLAWRVLGPVAIDLLWDVARLLEGQDASTKLQAAYYDEKKARPHNFNLSTLVCLPKAPAGSDGDSGDFYDPEGTRPLSVVNCDNRLVANAARLRWEKNLEHWVSPRQQGFLRGRSILANLLDLDTASMVTALSHQDGACILLDFAAAFPSISQDFTFSVLRSIGLPEQSLQLIRSLYDESYCRVSVQG